MVVTFTPPPTDATPTDAVLAIDVGGTFVKTAVIGPDVLVLGRIPTMDAEGSWSVERLGRIAAELHAAAVDAGVTPANLTIGVPGQVDEYHGAVQYSPNLPWHDVAVVDRVGEFVPCEVIVRHSVRLGALAESNLGIARGTGAMLFVSLGTGVAAAGASTGVVVADHVGAGDIGQMRIRSGVGEGQVLEEFASADGIARRYAERTGTDPDGVGAVDVHDAIRDDPVAQEVWDEAVDALADGLEWATMLFGPEMLVLGGGVVDAGADLVDPVAAGVTRRLGTERSPSVRAAAFGVYAGVVGAALTGWKKARWPVDQLGAIVAELASPATPPVPEQAPGPGST